MFVDFNILNQLGSPSINSNTFANRPAAGQTGRLFVSTDTFEIYRDNGTGWDLIGGPGAGTITGTGTATQVAYFTGAQTIGSSANLFWDATNSRLGIATATPGSRLDVHAPGTTGQFIAEFNATNAIGNTYLQFKYQGTNTWRIGNTYNGGNNFYALHNSPLNLDAVRFLASTNIAAFTAQHTYATGQAQSALFTYNLTVPNGTNFSTPNVIGAVNSFLNLSLGGNSTMPAGNRQGLEGNSRISFTGAGTFTITQGSTTRAYSAISSVHSFAGTAIGTITNLAGLRICFPDNTGSAINVTNNYGLLLNDQTTGSGTVTYTNRWGIFQEGTADVNLFAGPILQGTTTNPGFNIYTNGSLRADTSTTLAATSGGVLIGSSGTISSNAKLQIDSTNSGVLFPRMTTTQRNAITASAGLVIYNTTTNALEFFNGTSWTSGGGGGGGLTQDVQQVAFAALGSSVKGSIIGNSDFNLALTGTSLTSSNILFTTYYLPVAATISSVQFFLITSGSFTANNFNGLALYSYSGGTLTQRAITANVPTIFSGPANNWIPVNFTTPYSAPVGIYYVGILYSSSAQTTAPAVGSFITNPVQAGGYDFALGAKINGTLTGQTAFPASQLMSGVSNLTTSVTMLLT